MSSLYKLSIQGIRSFDTNGSETIQFGSPLTLICGQNGSGKTTIIECLKYITTGDLPPNSKGAAFILDPDVCGRSVVSAQVKLAYVNMKGNSMIATRTMQLTKKRGGRGTTTGHTFKTLEGNLTIIDKNQDKRALLTKSSELDLQIPRSLGCSKAILDYVLFCHQDDSLWPLSEASVLKKRFDEIFEASKYTKVLDSLKSINKEMTQDIKLLEQGVNHLKLDSDRAKRIKYKLEQTNDNVEALMEGIVEVKLKIEEKEHEAEKLFNTAQDYEQTLAEYDEINHTIATLTKQLERISKSMEFLTDMSDDELLNQRNNFEELNEGKKSQIQVLKEKFKTRKAEIEQLMANLNKLIRLDGTLRARESDYENNLKLLLTLHNEESLELAKEKLSKECTLLEKEHSNFQAASKKEETEKRTSLQKTLDSILKDKQNEEYAKLELASLTDKIAISKKQLGLFKTKVQDLDLMKTELEALEKQLNERKSKNEIAIIDKEIESLKGILASKEIEIEELNKKISITNKQSGIHSRIAYLKEQNQMKQRALDTILRQEEEQIKSILGTPLDYKQCQSQLQKIQESNSSKLEAQSNVVNNKLNEWQNVRTFKSAEEEKLSLLNKQIQKNKQIIMKASLSEEDINDYEHLIQELQDDYNTTYENMNTADLSIQFKVKAIEIAEKSNHCQLCQRPFDTLGLRKFITSLKESLEDTNLKEKLKTQFNEAKQELESVKSVNNNVLQYRGLVSEVNLCKDQLQKLQSEEITTKAAYDKEIESLNELKNISLSTDAISEVIGNITRFYGELGSNEAQIKELNDELNDYGTNNLSITELQSRQTLLHSESKDLREAVEEKSESKYRIIREIGRIENKVKDNKLEVSELEKKIGDIKNLETSVKEMESKITETKTRIDEISSSLSKLEETKSKESLELNAVIERNNLKQNDLSSVLENKRSLLKRFIGLYDDVKLYEAEYKNQLEENRDQIVMLERDETKGKEELGILDNEIRKLETEIAQSSKVQHNIIVNIDYRETERDIEINKTRLSSIDIESAKNKKERYQRLSKALREEISSLHSDHAGKLGEVKVLKDQVSNLKKELDTEYKDVDKNFHEEWVKLQTNMLASNDIQVYFKALDNAIMKYHSMKMEDINKILQELWTQTYKGTDIDSIAIKSDVNLQNKGNRSYNYRVVMNKNSVELDMRGRCSAGQKVLASILIRLALAECFGTNCGMIALDEPTTNLDAENSEALAIALHRIIQIRQHQSNFQLIVITHDENFLSHINGDQFADHFFRVQRNENQRSKIFRLPISLIHGE